MNRLGLLSGSALVACMVVVGTSACAQETRNFDIPAGSLRAGLDLFAAQADQQIFYAGDLVEGVRTQGVNGALTPPQALDRLLAGTGLGWTQTRSGVFYLRRRATDETAVVPTAQLDDVMVTGTLLRSSGDLASPVVMLDREALDRRGFATAAEALVDLPQNYAGSATPSVQLANADSGASNNTYATGVNLRGLGPASTLVLVNGRRLAGTGSRAEFADVSALPSAAVERIDVLLDGASALYGADAVAGVVNVIMRRSFEGQETRLRMAASQGGAEDITASHLAGTVWSSGAAYLAYEYQTVNALNSLDRSYTADGDLRPFGGTDHRALYSAPGNILFFNPATSAYESQYAIRPGAAGYAQGAGDFAAGQANLLSSSYGTDLIPAIERQSAYGRVRQSLGDRFELSGDVRYSRRDYEVAGGPNLGVFTVTRANPWFVSPTGAASHTIGYSLFRELGSVQQSGRSESLGLTLGGRYDLTPDWSVEVYGAYAQEKSDLGSYNRVHSRFLNEALGTIPDDPATPFRAAVDGYFNLFGDGDANPRSLLDFIAVGYTISESRSRAASANLLIQGVAARLPGGDVEVAIGAQVRKEDLETRSENFAATVAPQILAVPRRERTVSAVFAEARVPVVSDVNSRPGLRALDLSVAARVEDYDDFGSTTNPKVGLVWSPLRDLGVRASWGTSFRAAALPLLFDTSNVSGNFFARADGTRILSLLRTGGNPDLKPETSETFTFGVDYRPRGGPAFSANYFDTRFTDRIARPVSENINGVLVDPALAPFVTYVSPATNPADLALVQSFVGLPGFPTNYPPTTIGAIVDSRWVNTGAVRVRGFDLSGRYGWAVAGGRLTADASASLVLDYETQPTPTAPVRQVAGLIGYPVKLRARSGLTWTRGAFAAGANWNHVDDYEDRVGNRIDAWNTVDGQLAWSKGEGGVRVTLNVQNLFDEDPPFYDSAMGYGFDAGQANLLGRTFALQLTRRW